MPSQPAALCIDAGDDDPRHSERGNGAQRFAAKGCGFHRLELEADPHAEPFYLQTGT
jgi:hypothetical protein